MEPSAFRSDRPFQRARHAGIRLIAIIAMGAGVVVAPAAAAAGEPGRQDAGPPPRAADGQTAAPPPGLATAAMMTARAGVESPPPVSTATAEPSATEAGISTDPLAAVEPQQGDTSDDTSTSSDGTVSSTSSESEEPTNPTSTTSTSTTEPTGTEPVPAPSAGTDATTDDATAAEATSSEPAPTDETPTVAEAVESPMANDPLTSDVLDTDVSPEPAVPSWAAEVQITNESLDHPRIDPTVDARAAPTASSPTTTTPFGPSPARTAVSIERPTSSNLGQTPSIVEYQPTVSSEDSGPAGGSHGPAALTTGMAVAAAPRVTAAVAVAMDFARLSGGWAGPLVFNVWLRRQIRERRLSQRQLAAMSGVNHSTISRLVNDGRSPSLETATNLVRALRLEWTHEQIATYFDLLPERTLFPTQRVESALRGDLELDDADVRAIMEQYLHRRRRQRLAVADDSGSYRPVAPGDGGKPPMRRPES